MKSKKGWAGMALRGALAFAIIASTVSSIEVQAASKYKRGFVVATSEYICTPSGFGRKARCYLKSA